MKVIIISGPSGSGKTTLSIKILEKIKNGFVLNTDNYYKTGILSKIFSKLIKSYFDRKISFNQKLFRKDFNFILNNGKSNHKYSYDFTKKKITKSSTQTRNIELLIVEGIFAKQEIYNLNYKNCLLIELEINKNTCMERVIKRDVNERGKMRKIAKSDFLKSWNLFYLKNKTKNSKIKSFYLDNARIHDLDTVLKEIIKLNN